MNKSIRVAIVEDELSCARDLVRQLNHYAQENDVRFEIAQFNSAKRFLQEFRPVYDILFLDIEMPEMDGLSAAQKIYEQDTQLLIVFVTHIAKYAVQSYDVQAADYMLKPLQYPFFSMKMKKLLRRVQSREHKFLLLPVSGIVRRVAVHEIHYIEVINHRLIYHTSGGELKVKGTLRSITQELMGLAFARCNNCYLVNLAYLEEIREEDALVHGELLKISRSRRKEFVEAVLQYQRGGMP